VPYVQQLVRLNSRYLNKDDGAGGDKAGRNRPLPGLNGRGGLCNLIAQVSIFAHYRRPRRFHLLQAAPQHGGLAGQRQVKGREKRHSADQRQPAESGAQIYVPSCPLDAVA
jgi:hypothetical protein